MLTQKDDVDIHARRRQGLTISAIARHTGRDRKTIRAHLNGDRQVGQRARSVPDPFDRFAGYARERLAEDPHLWARTLFDEAVMLGYELSRLAHWRGHIVPHVVGHR
jgi:transposase